MTPYLESLLRPVEVSGDNASTGALQASPCSDSTCSGALQASPVQNAFTLWQRLRLGQSGPGKLG